RPHMNALAEHVRRFGETKASLVRDVSLLRDEVDRLADKAAEEAAAGNAKEQAEKTANAKLTLAMAYLKDGKRDKAAEKLGQIVKDFPGTKAAVEAEKLLKELK